MLKRFIGVLAVYAVGATIIWAGEQQRPQKMEEITFNCDTDAQCAALPPCALKAKAFAQGRAASGCDGGPDTEPYRLVGYDCEGATEPLYRDEEDEFPKCKVIKGIWE